MAIRKCLQIFTIHGYYIIFSLWNDNIRLCGFALKMVLYAPYTFGLRLMENHGTNQDKLHVMTTKTAEKTRWCINCGVHNRKRTTWGCEGHGLSVFRLLCLLLNRNVSTTDNPSALTFWKTEAKHRKFDWYMVTDSAYHEMWKSFAQIIPSRYRDELGFARSHAFSKAL